MHTCLLGYTKWEYWAQFHGSAYCRILRLRSWFPAYVQAPNFCASLVSVECLVTWSTHAQKPKFAANPWNTLAVSTKFPASVSADSVLTVSRAMKLGPGLWQLPNFSASKLILFRFWTTFHPHCRSKPYLWSCTLRYLPSPYWFACSHLNSYYIHSY